jgi:predicted transcriptional regulator
VNTGSIPYHVKVSLVTRALRNMFALSQDELYAEAKVSRSTLSKMERLSEVNPNASTLALLLSYFTDKGVDIEINDKSIVINLQEKAILDIIKSVKR